MVVTGGVVAGGGFGWLSALGARGPGGKHGRGNRGG